MTLRDVKAVDEVSLPHLGRHRCRRLVSLRSKTLRPRWSRSAMRARSCRALSNQGPRFSVCSKVVPRVRVLPSILLQVHWGAGCPARLRPMRSASIVRRAKPAMTGGRRPRGRARPGWTGAETPRYPGPPRSPATNRLHALFIASVVAACGCGAPVNGFFG